MLGAGGLTAGATTLKEDCPELWPSGLMTSTDQLCAAVVKTGLMTSCVVLNELIGRRADVRRAGR